MITRSEVGMSSWEFMNEVTKDSMDGSVLMVGIHLNSFEEGTRT